LSLALDLEEIKKAQKIDMFEDLENKTHFGKDEIKKLHRWVISKSENGFVSKSLFEEGLKAVGIVDPLLIEQFFGLFDSNHDGRIDFREFVCGLSTVLKGTSEEKLDLMFKSFDIDNDGYLDKDDMYVIFKISLQSSDKDLKKNDIHSLIRKYFPQLGKTVGISLQEFKDIVIENKLFKI